MSAGQTGALLVHLPINVLEEALLTPAVQELRHNELKEKEKLIDHGVSQVLMPHPHMQDRTGCNMKSVC